MERKGQKRVAVVGSGMAGLATTYLLHREVEQRYAVTVFEESKSLSLDSASVSISSRSSPSSIDRVDLPMRAFAGGYYNKLKAMYDHLGLEYRAQSFLFTFSKLSPKQNTFLNESSTPYFIHSSNNHRFPPLQPYGMPTKPWLLEIMYLLFFYTYFTLCCIFIRPQSRNDAETLQHYLARLRIPQYFTTYYILPLISSVTTCPHFELLQFPACDVVDYKRRTTAEQHYTLTNGVGSVQEKLAEGIVTRFSAHVLAVEPQASGKVRLHWRHSDDTHCLVQMTDEYDEVVIAVAPDIVGTIFEPLRAEMAKIPTTIVESIVHSDDNAIRPQSLALEENMGNAQSIFLRTDMNTGRTESIHLQPSGVLVTTCPFTQIGTKYLIQDPVKFTRVLRTPESRRIVNEIFTEEGWGDRVPEYMEMHEKSNPRWRNGDDGVWLAGGWCWDGMVLLEGCIISAIRVAEGLGVDVPF